jgi:hypothetical protein
VSIDLVIRGATVVRADGVVEGQEHPRALGEMTLWHGAQDIVFVRT